MSVGTLPAPANVPVLRHGERLSRAEFERRYNAMPDIKAELLDGVVYVTSTPVSAFHAGPHFDLIGWLGAYRIVTPGVIGSDNGTVRTPNGSDPQPDVFLRIHEDYGGKSRIDEDHYVAGVPEFVAEVAYYSLAYDDRIKRPFYQREGVREFLLWRVEEQIIEWFILRSGTYELLLPDTDGITRSEVFPGLWLDAEALAKRDMSAVVHAQQLGFASQEHQEFVASLRNNQVGKK